MIMSNFSTGALSRAEQDLSVHIKKATSPDETAPKRKHVRACIVYSWDHRSGRAFWNGIKLQPLQNDDIQLFKGLITIHKVLQEGHPSVLREAQNHVTWISSLSRGSGGGHGYSKLISEYVRLLLKKLSFHKIHPAFNGTFEYEEYLSLRTINDPNEGYEAIIDLMNLQDAIDDYQRLVFASIHHGQLSNECKISSLTPMVFESYGIYKFATSMLRAMHSTTNDEEALEPLRSRFYSQHHRIAEFYFDCSSIKYLTSLITIPTLTPDPPNLFSEDNEDGPALPKRPTEREPSIAPSTQSSAASAPPANNNADVESIGNEWWNQNQQYEEEQRQLEAQRQAELLQQQQLALQQQQQFEEQQRLQAEQQRAAQESLIRDQLQRQAEGRVAELERDILNLRGQHEQNQLMLDQYDRRVKALETELGQLNTNTNLQLESKNDLIKSLQEQVNLWKSKYESLAKLYSQLRQEHLDVLGKFNQVKAKAASAQEAIDKRERLERDLKAKNLELADLIRERDRARYDLDKLRGTDKEKIEKLERDLRIMTDKLTDSELSKGSDLSLILTKHSKELSDLEDALKAKQRVIDDYEQKGVIGDSDLLREKDEEIDILQETVATMENALKDMSLNQKEADSALDEQIDGLLIDHLGKLNHIIDAILVSGSERIQESLFEFESPMQAGNQNSTPSYLLSVIEKASSSATDFSTAFNNFIADGPNGDHAEIISSVIAFASTISDLLINTKGLGRLARNDQMLDDLSLNARQSAIASSNLFKSLLSTELKDLNDEQKTDRVINGNIEVQTSLQQLSKLAESMAPKSGFVNTANGDLGDVVDREMAKVADAITMANQRLTELLARPKDPKFSTFDVQVNEAILAAAIAVTSAIGALIRAATECQQEIVAQGRGSQSRTAYYKKHNRWTEGLISAAKAVALSTNILIETADGVLSGKNSPEELIVASNEVASSTAQLVAASRVKASFMSKTQDRLELASKSVTSACRSLVNKVQDILASRNTAQQEEIDYSKLSSHEFRTASMEQQVEVLKLEQQLEVARNKLFEIRKIEYREQEEEGLN